MFLIFSRNLISEESYWSERRDGILVLRDNLVFRQYVARTMPAITRNASCFATIWTFDVPLHINRQIRSFLVITYFGVVILTGNMLNDGACKLMVWYMWYF